MNLHDDNGNHVAPLHGHTAPIKVGTIPAYDGSFECPTMLTLLEAIVSVAPDGTVTVALSGRSLRSALAEMEEG